MLRGNLFIKIFIGFWLVTIASLGSWMLVSQYIDSTPIADAGPHPRPGPPRRFMLHLIYDLQNLDREQLAARVHRASRDHRVEIFLLKPDGGELFGRRVPGSVHKVAAKLEREGRRASLRTAGVVLTAHAIYRNQEGPLRAVLMFNRHPRGWLNTLKDRLWLQLSLAVLTSGLACFLLSMIFTRRLKALQLASRQLATGELDTRLKVRDRGGDETDELARDFNSMAEQLQQRILAQKNLLTDVSHELRSPLARLRIALSLAQRDEHARPQYLHRIEAEADRLESLVGQLLSSQKEDWNFDVHIDLVELLRQLCADAGFEGATQHKRVVFIHSIERAVVTSAGDLLHKSFDNIIRNALHHTGAETQVSVSLEKLADRYQIKVQDRGAGVPEEELEKLFAEFYRVDAARSRDTGGYGLGLAIAQRAMLAHGGTITAENTGGGLAVIATLPVS